MNNYTSNIQRIGLVNSGMFDLLELNLDVKAIHLVGQNNVGKTSLIALIQFLYFHNLQEMTFSQGTTETLSFYFRPEGSYILFEVLTIFGTRRTVGIYGTGTAATRQIFVFDGSFDLEDFLDDKRCVIPLEGIKQKFFSKTLRIYQNFGHYEKALLGQHTEAEYNIPMFDLTLTNFSLLRKLLQGLLRLDRLTSTQVRDFIINIVETSGVKTEINVAQDFETKHREIKTIQAKLDDLKLLKPIIKKWQSLRQKIEEIMHEIKADSAYLFHVSSRYLSFLETQKQQIHSRYQAIEQELSDLDGQKETLIEKRTEYKRQEENWAEVIREFDELQRFCERHSKFHSQQELERLIIKKSDLHTILKNVDVEKSEILKRRLKRKLEEQSSLVRQMENRTIEQLWTEAKFSEEHRALLRFLLSEKLISLPVNVITAPDEFLATSRQVTNYLYADGTFRGFGLNIPKSKWYIPEDEIEPLEERLEAIKQQISDFVQKIEVAENREQKEAELKKIQQNIQEIQNIIQKFNQLDNFRDQYENLSLCRKEEENAQAGYNQVDVALKKIGQKIADLRKDSEKIHTKQSEIENEIRSVKKTHQTIETFDTPCPMDVDILPETELSQQYLASQTRLNDKKTELRQLQSNLSEPQASLESRYDRESPDISLKQWIEKRLDIADEIASFEEQLQESYNNLISLVKGELDKLIRAFEAVQSRITDINNLIKKVSISNIERIEVNIKKSELVEAIKQTSQIQLDFFSLDHYNTSFEDAQALIDDYLTKIRSYGKEIKLQDMFHLEFQVKFDHSEGLESKSEIHQFESNGTQTGVKVVLYLGLIKLLQGQRKQISTRIPFFLDEVGRIDSNNMKQLISYCDKNNFLPIFASPRERSDIPVNYIFRLNGRRSSLVNQFISIEQSDAV